MSVGTSLRLGPGSDVLKVLTSRIFGPVTAAVVATTVIVGVIQAAGTSIPPGVQVVPFAVSIVLFGLPHGALDHLVPARLAPRLGVGRSIGIVVVAYGVIGSATALLWWTLPGVGFVSFILLTWFHWGQGDLFIDHLLGDGTRGRAGAGLTVAVRGALPMLVPLVSHPRDYAAVLQETTAVVTHHSSASTPTFPTAVPVVAACIVAGLLVAQAVALRHTGRIAPRQTVEAVALVAFFVVVPPVLAVGLYFTLWHSVRHIVRLELTDPLSAGELRAGRRWRPFRRFLAQAWPITLIAIALLIAMAIVLRSTNLGLYLVLIAVLTTPHAFVVTWMDVRQRSWTPTNHPPGSR